jgi:hypothetical protein
LSKPGTGRGNGSEAPVELRSKLVFKFPQAFIAIKGHPGISVILDGQIASKGAESSALDTIKIRFGSEGGGDDLLPDVSGINDRVEYLPFIGLHTVHPRVSHFGV